MRPERRRAPQANDLYSMSKIKTISEAEAVRAAVRNGYGQIAQKDGSCCSGVSCCGSNAEDSTRLLIPAGVGDFTGAYLGMYASGNGQSSASVADFDWFEYSGRQ